MAAELVGVISKTIATEMAPLKKALGFALQAALDPWETIYSETTTAVQAAETNNKWRVLDYYGIQENHCMILGKVDGPIISAHIWPSHTRGNGLEILELSRNDVNNVRNFLRLHNILGKLFDKKELILVPHASSSAEKIIFEVIILDPVVLTGHIRVNNEDVPYEDLLRKTINYEFSEQRKPFLRLLALHAMKAISSAAQMGWIAEPMESESRNRAYSLARYSLGEDPERISAFLNSKPDGSNI
jgi:hypothetical protein